jgi:hypothetical protein
MSLREAGVTYDGPYLPVWQTQSTIAELGSTYNLDQMSVPSIPGQERIGAEVVMQEHKPVISEPYLLADTSNSEQYQEDLNEAIWLSSYVPHMNIEAIMRLIFDFQFPILADAYDKIQWMIETYSRNDHQAVAILSISIYWTYMVRDLPPHGSTGILVVFENACTQKLTSSHRNQGHQIWIIWTSPLQAKRSWNGNILEDKRLPLDSLDHSSTNPLINKLHTMRQSYLQSCPQLWQELATINPHQVALIDEHLCDGLNITLTFAEMNHNIVDLAATIFQNLGIGPKRQQVAIFGENSARWLQIDHGIQRAGGVSAVRGADAPPEELRYIYTHSDAAGIVVLPGPKLLQKPLQDATVSHPNVMESTQSPVGL